MKKKYKEIRLTEAEFKQLNLLLGVMGEKFPDFFWKSVHARFEQIRNDKDFSSFNVKNALYNLFGEINMSTIFKR